MKKILTFKQLALFSALVSVGYTEVNAQAINEGFNDITTLVPGGWFRQNNSNPLGAQQWFQGTPTTATPTPGPFNAYAGAVNAYIAANFANTTGGTGTISNWLVTPNRTFRNGDVITFYTRKPTILTGQTDYPDRLEVRLSTNGASTNVGATATALGDFTTLLLSINPSLVVGGYPQVWTQYTITISGLPAPTSGRVAFRYFVTNGGPTGANSDYIGIDEFVYTPYVCPVLTVNPSTLSGGTAGTAYNQSLSQTGALGAPGYAVTAGALPPGLTLSAGGTISGTPTATGTFNFTASVSDASGCSGSRPYSITVVCPANPIAVNFSAVCSNAAPVDLVASASPAGGIFSGTGVTGNSFDPAAGTQTITYDLTDAYGCPHQSNGTLIVNTAPTVTQSALTAVCEASGDVTLSGGSPAGGTYSGTNVAGGLFSPIAAGTTDVIYTYTDANGCTEDDTTSMLVNALPVVTMGALTAACENDADITLSGGAPAGGTYSGTGVTAGVFDPSAGTQTITYTYTDINGCSNDATASMAVNTPPVVTLNPLTAVCEGSPDITLTGESPAGGIYSGTNVSGGMFSPVAAGTTDVIYTYTDANGCTEDDTTSMEVYALPVVTMGALSAVCEGSSDITLSGGSPAGGTYSGTNVSAGMFSPVAAGTTDVIYTYADANGCSEDDTTSMVVNALPVVTFSPLSNVCVNSGNVDLSTNGSPFGGLYTGYNVAFGFFNPDSANTFSITYIYTDGNGCIDSASQSITVDPCVGLTKNTAVTSLNYFPNPNTGSFTLQFVQSVKMDLSVEITDIQGRSVAKDVRPSFEGSYSKEFDLSTYAKGVYTMEVRSGKQSSFYKIVVQ